MHDPNMTHVLALDAVAVTFPHDTLAFVLALHTLVLAYGYVRVITNAICTCVMN
jgi:hypothetical protein